MRTGRSAEASLRGGLQVVKICYGIRLRPQAHLASIFESVVCGLDFLVAVVVTSNLVSCSFHAQFVPFSRGDFQVCARELATAAVHYMIEPVIVLKGVGTNNVIVVRVFQTKNQSSCAVNDR